MRKILVALILLSWALLVGLLGVELASMAHVGPWQPQSIGQVLQSDFPGNTGNA